MNLYEAIFIWTALYFYISSFFSFLWGFVFKKDKAVNWGWRLAVFGFIPQNISMAIRWVATGHAPVMKEYENSVLGAWFMIVLYMVLRRWHKKMEAIGVGIMPVVLLMIGNGIMTKPILEPLAPPFKSNWLVFHVFFAWIAYGAFCIAAALSVLYLLKERASSRGRAIPFYDRLPDINALNDLILKTIIFGFITLTVEIGAGAIWAYGLWGSYWGWDPIETWSLLTWLVYAIYIHLVVTLGWRGRRMAWLAIFAILFEFITFGGFGYLGGIHTPIL